MGQNRKVWNADGLGNRFKFIFGLLFAVFILKPCAAYEFSVEGEIQIREYYKGVLELSTNYLFRAEVNDCNSRIRVFGGWHNQVDYYEYGFNGECSYLCVKFPTNNAGAAVELPDNRKVPAKMDKPVKPANDATLTIYATEVPEGGRGIEPVWIAYASRCFFELRTSNTKIEPVWTKGNGRLRGGTQVKAHWRMDSHLPKLLEAMTDYSDDELQTGDTTNSIYSVITWTNVVGMNLPLTFQITQFRAFESNNRQCVYTGLAHTFREGCGVTNFFPPELTMVATRVFDERPAKEKNPVAWKTVAKPIPAPQQK